MAIMEISVVPLGTKTTSVGEYVAAIQKILDESPFNYKLTDMGTLVEGDVKDLLSIAAKLHESPFSKGAMRVYTVIKIDDRRDKSVKLGEKVASVRQKMS